MEIPNTTYIDQLAGDDHVFKEKLIKILKKEFPQEILNYENNIKAKAFIKAAKNVHKLKHKFGILGLEKGYTIAIEYEENLKIASTQLQSEFDDILQRANTFVQSL